METSAVIYGQSWDSLQTAIKVASDRQKVLATNIANIESDNFSKLSFKDELGKATKRQVDKQTILDEQLGQLAQNNLKMSSYASLMSSKIKLLKKVVTLGKG